MIYKNFAKSKVTLDLTIFRDVWMLCLGIQNRLACDKVQIIQVKELLQRINLNSTVFCSLLILAHGAHCHRLKVLGNPFLFLKLGSKHSFESSLQLRYEYDYSLLD